MKLFSSSHYSLRKSAHVLRHLYRLYLKKRLRLSPTEQKQIESALRTLQNHLLEKNRELSSLAAKTAEEYEKSLLKKTPFEKLRDSVFALAIALIAAILIRQVWFELYEIPSGSMRPTLKEQDKLMVSKTTFGINVPLTTDHFLFDPNLAQRNGIFIFTGENMDIRDVDTMYFYIFPGKKQYIKRMMGKPGDTIYFYGGDLYGIDEQGKDISSSLQLAELSKIEHIPFLHFDGKVLVPSQPTNGIYSPVTFYQMNEPIARLTLSSQNQVRGEMLSVCTSPTQCQAPVKDYGLLWGMNNFGMTRLLTKQQARLLTDENLDTMPNGVLYLEIKHHPSILSAKLGRDERGRMRPLLGYSSSLLPLDEAHAKALFDNMYTARFIVKNGFAYRFGLNAKYIANTSFLPHLPGVPDGTYEFYYGKAYEIKWQGITTELPKNHPLYTFTLERLQLFYNLGIEFDTRFSPQNKLLNIMPSRYTYFKNQGLYLLGADIFSQDDPLLQNFLEREKTRKLSHSQQNPYFAFEDNGPPLKSDGTLDIELIKSQGLTIPPHSYLALGDNHAMSADSRDFGFVPQGNVRGAPDWIFWPPGARWGYPNQPTYPFMNLPRSIVWLTIAVLGGGFYMINRKRHRLPLDLDFSSDTK